MDRKSKFWREKIFSKTLIGLEVAQLCWRVQPVIACICPSSSFTNSGKYKCKFTIQIYKYRQIQIQIYKYRHVSLSAPAWSKDRLQNVNKGHLRSVLMSLCTTAIFSSAIVRQAVRLNSAAIFLENQNKSFSQGENIGELVIDVSQARGEKAKGLKFYAQHCCHHIWSSRMSLTWSAWPSRSAPLMLWQWKCVTMKKVVKEGTQRHLSCASPASQMRLTMRGTYVGATLWPRFFSLTKIQILFCTNTLNNLQKYTSRGWQRGERISEQLFDQDFLFRFFRR